MGRLRPHTLAKHRRSGCLFFCARRRVVSPPIPWSFKGIEMNGKRDFDRWRKKLEEVTQQVTTVKEEMEEKMEQADESEGRDSGSGARPRTRVPRSRYAREGISEIQVSRDSDNDIYVWIKEPARTVELRGCEMVLVLLRVLWAKESERPSKNSDGIVPVKTKRELIRALEEVSKKTKVSEACLRMHIRRLRVKLLCAGIDADVIETLNGGYRFRRKIGGIVIDDA